MTELLDNTPTLYPRIFIRHRRQLRAFLLDDQAWFLDAEGALEHGLLISEPAVYATLIHYYHPENRCIRH
ncbi:hypothetical protein [Pseudomonas tohonis]|uniref:hypothetical protein n=1 Tax=Pseudomonas tohonis TaxID=2725477 RepID=UPI0021D836DB|nr:hypothetical protein [Pseudomonas tohonis]UXY52889.1 hypothetical protein N9L84_28765 [Pseudomonas tohonis]